MSAINQDELDAFLYQVESVNKQVKDIVEGKVDLDELERKEKARAERKKREEEEENRLKEEKLRAGRPGKGISKDYVCYCKGCQTEYLISLSKCTHCGRDTVAREDRMKDLEARLEEYKEQKAAKKLRKAKWDNWRKTQAIRYSKMSTNYQKWDYFENDSSDDEEQKKEPIIPDDPNVKMLEKDIEERGKRRRENRRQAEEIKDRGNDYMKKGKYKAAYKKYTQAIELSRDYFILYTNRALASLKMEKWNDVVEDCTKVLDYCECFDEGYTKHKDLCYKALLRRAAALQGMKKLDLAKKDVEEALNLFPNMEEPTKLLKRINEDIELEEKATEAIKLSENSELLQKIADRIKEVEAIQYSEENAEKLEELMGKLKASVLAKEEAQLFFIKNGGLALLLRLMDVSSAILLLEGLLKREKLCEELQRLHGFEAIVEYLCKKAMNGKLISSNKLKSIVKMLDILETGSLNEFVRHELASQNKVADVCVSVINSLDAKSIRPEIAPLFSFMSNLAYQGGRFKELIRGKMEEVMDKFKQTLELLAYKGDSATLILMILGLISNLCTNPDIRNYVASNPYKILDHIIANSLSMLKDKPLAWESYLEEALAILINVSVNETSHQYILQAELPYTFDKNLKTIIAKYPKILERYFNLCSKMSKSSGYILQLLQANNLIVHSFASVGPLSELADDSIRIIARFLESDAICKKIEENKIPTGTFVEAIKETLKTSYEKKQKAMYINGCTMVSRFLKKYPKHLPDFKDIIMVLIQSVKDEVGLVRKNAAILLSNIAMDEGNKEVVRSLHGIDVLASVKDFL